MARIIIVYQSQTLYLLSHIIYNVSIVTDARDFLHYTRIIPPIIRLYRFMVVHVKTLRISDPIKLLVSAYSVMYIIIIGHDCSKFSTVYPSKKSAKNGKIFRRLDVRRVDFSCSVVALKTIAPQTRNMKAPSLSRA